MPVFSHHSMASLRPPAFAGAGSMAIAPDGDGRGWPVPANATDQPAQMGSHLLAVRCFAGTQDRLHAMAGLGVIDMDRQKAPLVVMRVEQRQLLMAVHGIGGGLRLLHDRLCWVGAALLPRIHPSHLH